MLGTSDIEQKSGTRPLSLLLQSPVRSIWESRIMPRPLSLTHYWYQAAVPAQRVLPWNERVSQSPICCYFWSHIELLFHPNLVRVSYSCYLNGPSDSLNSSVSVAPACLSSNRALSSSVLSLTKIWTLTEDWLCLIIQTLQFLLYFRSVQTLQALQTILDNKWIEMSIFFKFFIILILVFSFQ